MHIYCTCMDMNAHMIYIATICMYICAYMEAGEGAAIPLMYPGGGRGGRGREKGGRGTLFWMVGSALCCSSTSTHSLCP